MTKPLIDQAVDRFLAWKLPEDFSPDAGISFKPTFNDHLPVPMRHEPVGTNLFRASQAKAMLEHVAAPLLARVAELEALHRTYYNQPFAEACQNAAIAERERCIKRLLELVPMADPDLTTEYLREELAK